MVERIVSRIGSTPFVLACRFVLPLCLRYNTLMQNTGPDQAQPGQTITPGVPVAQPASDIPLSAPAAPIAPAASPVASVSPAPPVSETLPPAPVPAAALPDPTPAPAPDQAAPAGTPASTGWYSGEKLSGLSDVREGLNRPGEGYAAAAADNAGPQAVTWTASEFIAHEKSTAWFAGLAAAAAAMSVLLFLITKDWVSVVVAVVAALMLGIYGTRKPRQLPYRLDGQGISIGQKRYGYHQFRSFAIVPEGAFASIIFMPLKRFAPPLAIYYAPEAEEQIVGLLADILPFDDQHRQDATERLMRLIRF